jgi:hypothetical protein
MLPLTRLGQALAERYWRTGLASPAGLPDLDAAVAALEEAYGYMRDGDGLRGQLAGQLGWLMAARHSVHTEDEQDRESGIKLLEEALAAGNLSAFLRTMSRMQLGQLCLSRATPILMSPGMAMNLMNGQVPPDIAAHVNRAVECFRMVLADESANEVVIEAAEGMLAVAETMQTLVSGGAGAGLDLQRLMDAMAKLQNLKDRFTRGGAPGLGAGGTASFLSFTDFQDILNMDSMDRPLTFMQQPTGEDERKPVERPVRRPVADPTPPDGDQLRRSLRDSLFGPNAEDPSWALAAALLLPDARPPEVAVVDEAVALARMVVDAEQGDAEDWFVLAVVLYLRDRLDDGGDDADRVAGAESLLTAVRKVPLEHPAATTMLRALGAFLEEDRPLGGVLDIVADGFADRLDAAITAGAAEDAAALASLHALRCLCRAADALAELGRAAVPPDYPWQNTLKAATRVAG